ncbi:MAG TPA: multidrug efflux RND transporter permease subunit [Azospirillaceae bacterium]|nr:multidrug efflux RND transporter permease subunit [Azospirillaceae bacterium]
MISRFFIDRPVFAAVLSIVIVLAGLMAMRALPVEQYPQIVPPQVTIQASYPGASAQVLAETVAAPIEQQVNGVEDMLYMTSTASSSGTLSISVSFAIGTDPDQATINVSNRVQAAEPLLPEEVRRSGVRVQKRSSSILQVITVFSPDARYDPIYVSNYALLNIIDELKRIPGVGDASLFGAKDYAMRIWLRPDRLAQYGLTPADVAAAVREQNAQFAAGQFGQEPMSDPQPFTYSVTTPGRLADPKEFEQIILRSDPATGGALRLGDVARVELGAQDYSFQARYNGRSAVAMGIYLQPGANAIATSAAIAERLEALSARFPEGLEYDIPYNTTRFVEVSIEEVVHTFVEALVLVVVVVFLFLQNVRATLIPLLAIPVSLVGTFAGMYLLGFSINLLTLFGLVLAIGIVVDDAIVVLENVERVMRDEGKSARDAAIQAMREVSGPVIAIVLVLAAVFVPVAFLGGLAGVMYKQFAITIAVSVAISGIVALTLTPALCALLLKEGHREPAKPFRVFNAWFDRMTGGYLRGVDFFLRRALAGVAVFLAVLAAAALLYARIPGALVPAEDQGSIILNTQLPPASSLSRTVEVNHEVERRLLAMPEVSGVVSFSGFDILGGGLKTSAGTFFTQLTLWDERTEAEQDARNLAPAVMGRMADIKEAMVLAFNPPPIQGISLTGGFEGYLQQRGGGGPAELGQAVQRLVAAAAQRPELAGVSTTFNAGVPQYRVELNRDRVKALGVPVSAVYTTMQATFGAYYVNDFTLFGRTYRVTLESEAPFRETPEDLRHVFVRSDTGEMIPLDALLSVERVAGPDMLERFNVFPAAKLMGNPAPGFSSGEALAAMEQLVADTLGTDYALAWTGSAYQERAASGTSAVAFGFGLLMVFLILAAQYERWTLPLAVVTAVPFGILGALLAVWLRGLSNDIYFQIGLLVLIGLSAKNAILIVEFAVIQREAGKDPAQAAADAARLRFRPIVMTSLAFILGCLPLVVSSGAGSASRHSLGTGVVGGMLGATVLAIFVIPLAYALIERLASRRLRRPPAAAHHRPAE